MACRCSNGATGTLDIAEMARATASGDVNRIILVFGLVFLVAGLAFKLGVVPFHMWVPDVYHGAPTAVALLVGGAPKLAAFAIFVRLLVEGLSPLAIDWQQMLIVLSVLSMGLGNIAALKQDQHQAHAGLFDHLRKWVSCCSACWPGQAART